MKFLFSVGVGVLFIGWLGLASVSAQDGDVRVEPFFAAADGPKVIRLPKPEYPDDARSVGLGGKVSVRITIDEAGNVIGAEDASGPYPICQSVTEPNVLALRAAALTAASQARFEPTSENGTPVKVTGMLKYDFISSKKAAATTLSGSYRVVGSLEHATGNGSVLSGKASHLPKPPYPPAARAVRASGSVQIRVLIDERGNMYSAEAISGHPLLRSAAEVAACKARFTPTQLEGKPVRITGTITYNFVP